MGYLYLNFLDNLEKGSKSWDDFYTTSLTEQYEVLKRKLGGYASGTLQEFIAMAFPANTLKYYNISMPSFDRRMKENRFGKQCIYNIVIRPEKDSYLSYILPSNYDFIVIGDVTFGSVIDITVKGIELIDSKVAKFGEKKVLCTAACAFSKKEIPNRATGRTSQVADYGTRDMHDAVLTNDFVSSLANQLYPVPHPEKAMKVFSDWLKYIQFRKYYLGKQSERCEEITDIAVCNSYMITKEAYRRNEDAFSAYLLDGIEQFSKGEQIILSKEVTGSDSFPLIRIEIAKNRKQILSDTYGRNGKGKPKYEANLQRYTRESMGVSSIPPKYDEKGNMKGLKAYLLGERYLFTYVDVEPDLTALDKKYEKDYASACAEIDSKYLSIINSELVKFMEGQTPIVRRMYDVKLAQYKQELDDSLERDIEENGDKEIKRAFETELAKKLAPLDAQRKKKHDEIRANMKKLKDKKLSEDEYDEEYDALRASAETVDMEYYQEVDKIKASISLRDFYVRRNQELLSKKEKSLAISFQSEIECIKKEKKAQLEVQYRGSIENEKTEVKERLQSKLKADKAEKIENETVRKYLIYFRPEDTNEKVKDLEKQIEAIDANYLTYDNRAEKAKIERQEKALNSILGGYVKNPFLPTYLFSPETLAQTVRDTTKEPEWCLESLNDRQKLAVRRALASESLFLLQGPPGTGKTQVIAEITAQLTKQGKKVLISSETHKAIDNVFERLPKIPEIRPLRLIPSQNGKETNYSPERLVDNFYLNISGNLEKQVRRFEHFEETKLVFDEQMKALRFDYEKVLKLKRDNANIERERTSLIDLINKLNIELEQIRETLSIAKEETEKYRRTNKYIESYRFDGEGAVEIYMEQFRREVQDLLLSFACLEEVPIDKVYELARIDVETVRDELNSILSEDIIVKLKSRQQELRGILSGLRDPDTDEAPEEGDENYEEYKKYQTELKNVVNSIKTAQSSATFDFSESIIFALVPSIINSKELLKQLPEELTAFKIKLQGVVNSIKSNLDVKISSLSQKESEIEYAISDKQLEISEKKKRYEELGENEGIEAYGELNSALKQKITRFFRDFDIVKEYDSDNLEEAFTIIAEEWRKLESGYKSTQQENKVKIPMYKEIVKYLSQEDILEEDRQSYTRELFNNVNVFGITCTSRDRFTKNQLQELDRYGIESVDIRTQGIDVVIIDEVSKSSFLDLLIPILYGKTVILVGDHRQLPPMYDLRHMRKDDFEGLDESIISKEINDGYTALYEECFFKTLYESVPSDFKVMLNKQYRCHSHIMEVFNHFYGGNQKGLTVGKKQQDDEKEHNLSVKINGNSIIEPKHHIYFIDCDQRESSAYEGSTSKVNEQEAAVAMVLLRELDKASTELEKQGKIKVSKDKKIDERPSIGVICTYGDQANLIKKKRKYQQFSGFSGKQDEKLVISTVDDFQGDERDIIIVSMVRNPAGNRYDAEFIKKFERINVALSRARKMLIVVGSRKFLTEAGVIDLPDLDGNHALDKVNFHVYKEIIDTINFRGRVLTARDIIGE